MITLFDEKKNGQAPKNTSFGDVVWKMEKLTPESPKKDGSAESYLHTISKTPEEYKCTTLVATTINADNQCSVCQQEKDTRLCRLVQKDKVSDIPICSDCINVFVEYNPDSVYDFEPKETKTK